MNAPELLAARLHNHLLGGHSISKPQEIVARMGAMQSQTPDLAKWAIGVRLNDMAEQDIGDALNTGKIIRTHILRPTWHFVSAEDVHWMNALSRPRLIPVYTSYCKMAGVDKALAYRLIPAVERVLAGGEHLTRQALGEMLKVSDDSIKLAILFAEIEGVLCNGIQKGRKQTYTLLSEWAPSRAPHLNREESLERLARIYFTSHAPATLHDFVWWSGLSLTDCRQGLDAIKNDFVCTQLNGREFWMRNDIYMPPADKVSALLLPPFDEFVVSYKDRSELIEDCHYSKVMTRNGLFSPTIMLNGEIVGYWKKVKQKNTFSTELFFFTKISNKTRDLFAPEIKRMENFWEK